MPAETVSYALADPTIDGLTLSFAGSPLGEQCMFDMKAAIAAANANGQFSVCDNAIKQVLDSSKYVVKTQVGSVHLYLPIGVNGWTVENFASGPNATFQTCNCMMTDQTGKYLLGGELYVYDPDTTVTSVYVAVLRLNQDLSVDTTFGQSGWWLLSVPTWFTAEIQGIALDPITHNIVIGGGIGDSARFGGADAAFAARINTNGTIDTTFNSTGYQVWQPSGSTQVLGLTASVDSSGRAIVGGIMDVSSQVGMFFATRFTTAGAIDTTWGTAGTTKTNVGGSLSGTPNPTGVQWSEPWGSRIDSVGRVYQGGLAYESFSTTTGPAANPAGQNRLNLSSSSDVFPGDIFVINQGGATQETVLVNQTFVGSTNVTLSSNLQFAHSPGESITWSGYAVAIARYTTSGVLDTTFNTTGYVVYRFLSSNQGLALVLQNDDKVVAGGIAYGGGSGMFTIRYNTDGTLDTTYNSRGWNVYDNDTGAGIQAMAIGSSNSVYTGNIQGPIASPRHARQTTKFLASGVIDITFGSSGDLLSEATPAPRFSTNGVAFGSNGDIVAAGVSGAPGAGFGAVQAWAATRASSTGSFVY